MSIYNTIINSSLIQDNIKYYWGYQFNLAENFLVDYLKRNNAFSKGMNVCEIGCAEGGVLAAFVNSGADYALGTDIATARLDAGKQINSLLNINIEFIAHDIINQDIDPRFIEKFDLILLRDVIEHLENPELALAKIKTMLKPGAKLYVTFPPYNSAFGGHQHTLNSLIGKIPFIHNLPTNLFFNLIKNGRALDLAEVKRLNGIKLTPRKMLNCIEKCAYKIVKEEYFLIRPVYKMKFGLPSLKLTPLRHLPFVKSILSMEAGYILEK